MASAATKATSADQLPPAELFDETFVVKLMKGRKIEARFTLHKGVAAFSSDYFEAAMKKGTFKEGKDSCIEIADVEKRCFSQLVAWMYHRKFEDYGGADSYNALLALFIIADRFMIPFLGDVLINRMHEKALAEYPPLLPLVDVAYDNTQEGSGLRRFAIDLWVKSSSKMLVKRTRGTDWDREILCDVMEAMFEDRDDLASGAGWKARLLKMDLCKYHAHKEDERCPASK